jgi:hypothetical protein
VITPGDRVKYKVHNNTAAREKHGGPTRKGYLLANPLGRMCETLLDGDPYSIYVQCDRLELIPDERDEEVVSRANRKPPVMKQVQINKESQKTMPTATKPNVRELRRQAKALKITGWSDMDTEELTAAIEAAETSGSKPKSRATKAAAEVGRTAKKTTRATTAKKGNAPVASAKKKAKAEPEAEEPEVAENGNPYKEGTNLFHITEELIRGGKRVDMVKRLKRKIELNPRTESDDYDTDAELDRRVLIVGQLLRRDHGFEVVREGRGPEDGTIVATPPE